MELREALEILAESKEDLADAAFNSNMPAEKVHNIFLALEEVTSYLDEGGEKLE